MTAVKCVDVEFTEVAKPVMAKDRFPRIVIIVILAEFCERFSYSAMRAFLTLYLRSKLGYSDDGATEIYHIFSTFVYVFPIFGGILADSYFGKFRTILNMMFIYAAGNLLVALAAIPQLDLPARLCTMLGLFMITVGTGGIKPCVTAFGGDQFKLPEQERHLAVYFSVLYFTLCLGSLIAKTVSPILRSEVHCFGDKDCYSLAFGAPGFVVLLSIVVFVSAKNRYVIKKPDGNVVVDFVKCISLGIKNVVSNRKNYEKRSHWLDTTEASYDKKFVADVKKTLSILRLFSVLPVFWALLDQMGSRWTLQATKMDGRFGFVTVKPDQMQVIAPIYILILIPSIQKIYSKLEKRNIMKSPLQRMTLGGTLAGVAFIASGIVELYLRTSYPQLPQPGLMQLRLFNGHACSIAINNDAENITYTIPPLSYYVNKDMKVDIHKNLSLGLSGSCIEPAVETVALEDSAAISFYYSPSGMVRYRDKIDKSKAGFPIVRFLVSSNVDNAHLVLYNERRKEIETYVGTGVSEPHEVFASTYSLRMGNVTVRQDIELESGGVYTIQLQRRSEGDYDSNVIVVTTANSITMAWLLPQFFIISLGEVLFAVTGTEFAFKEAPASMKAVMTATWLLTEAAGNVLIILITRLFVSYDQVGKRVFYVQELPVSRKNSTTALWLFTVRTDKASIIFAIRPFATQFFMYTGLMFVAMAVFHFIAKRYKFTKENSVVTCDTKKSRSNNEVLYLQVQQAEDCIDS